MNAIPFDSNSMHSIRRGRAFSMTELLVVIAIIAVLAGLLLVALRGVRTRALALSTQSTMQEFSKACDAFQIDHGSYPGIIPEGILAANPNISGTENALLHLMGGYRVLSPFDPPGGAAETEYDNYGTCGDNIRCITFGTGDNQWQLKVDVNRIGEGPVINGKPFAPYFTPKGDELRVISGQENENDLPLPDLVDAWGQPIIYVRRTRKVGPLAGEDDDVPKPQFMLGTMRPYIDSDRLADFGRNQIYHLTNNPGGSILGGPNIVDPSATFAQIIRHPSFGAPEEPITGTARGAYVLISAGKDGIYFSGQDGPGTPLNPVEDIVTGNFGNPQVVEEYDDIRLFGGG